MSIDPARVSCPRCNAAPDVDCVDAAADVHRPAQVVGMSGGIFAHQERVEEAELLDRDKRQQWITAWATREFGVDQAMSVPQRGLRLLEETIEAYQACGGTAEKAHAYVDYVFGRELGTVSQELGGVGICVLALAAAAGVSAEDCERAEFERILAKPPGYFTARNQAKNDAGFLTDELSGATSSADRTSKATFEESVKKIAEISTFVLEENASLKAKLEEAIQTIVELRDARESPSQRGMFVYEVTMENRATKHRCKLYVTANSATDALQVASSDTGRFVDPNWRAVHASSYMTSVEPFISVTE